MLGSHILTIDVRYTFLFNRSFHPGVFHKVLCSMYFCVAPSQSLHSILYKEVSHSFLTLSDTAGKETNLKERHSFNFSFSNILSLTIHFLCVLFCIQAIYQSALSINQWEWDGLSSERVECFLSNRFKISTCAIKSEIFLILSACLSQDIQEISFLFWIDNERTS